MPASSQRSFESAIGEPASRVLKFMGPRGKSIGAAWRREVGALGLRPDELLLNTRLDFLEWSNRLRRSRYHDLRKGIQEFGRGIAQQGIRLDLAVAAFDRLFEISLSRLIRDTSKWMSPALALSRLHALIGFWAVSGYMGHSAAEGEWLTDARAGEGRGASPEITNIYEQERRRLSRDLHDDIGHDLILIKLYLESMALESGATHVKEVQPRISEAIAIVSHAIDAVRRLVLDLGPAVFENLGFLPAVRSYIAKFSERSKIPVTLREGDLPSTIPSTHQVALYRVLQGALSNVLEHASAKHVTVSLGSQSGSALIMVIEDDGIGFNLGAAQQRGSFGLTTMRERVEVLGGRIHWQSRHATLSSRGHGTRIEIDLPLRVAAKSELRHAKAN